MAIIFISYRRTDSSGWTRGLHERLASTFESDSIFYDVDDITIGEDFISAVVNNLQNCRVVLVIIGPNWLKTANPDGSLRLEHADDHVRREIELALQRNVKIIPVLVGGAVMPTARQLPPSIAALSSRNAHPVSDSRFSGDMNELVRAIQNFCGIAPQPQQTKAPGKKKGFSGLSFVLGGVIAAVLVVSGIIFLIFLAAVSVENGNNSGNKDRANNTTPTKVVEDDSAVRSQIYCDGFKQGVSNQMNYGRVNTPLCVSAEDLSGYGNDQIRCGGFVAGIVETARLQGDSYTADEIDNLASACLAEIE